MSSLCENKAFLSAHCHWGYTVNIHWETSPNLAVFLFVFLHNRHQLIGKSVHGMWPALDQVSALYTCNALVADTL